MVFQELIHNMKLKYLIVSINDIPVPVIFSELLQHKDCVPNGTEPLSGGYLTIQNGKAVCYSESISLHLRSGAGDSNLVTSYLS